jgi:hypothetical protein
MINKVYGETLTVDDDKKNLKNKLSVCIPLSELTDFFNQTQCVPSMLVSGMRLSIELEDPSIAFKCDVTDPSLSYVVSNSHIQMELVTFTDSVVRKLAQESSKNGLEFSWNSYHRSEDVSTVGRRSIEISKALSRCNWAAAIVRETSKCTIGTTEARTVDSFESVTGFPVRRYQWNLGSHYLPGTENTDKGSAYLMALATFGKLGSHAQPASVDFKQYKLGKGLIAQSFETSSTLANSGASVDAQRGLVLNVEFSSPTSAYTVTTFVNHVKMASSFLSNVVVRM